MPDSKGRKEKEGFTECLQYDYAPERDLAELLPGNLLAKGLVKAIGETTNTL